MHEKKHPQGTLSGFRALTLAQPNVIARGRRFPDPVMVE
jgi:hypothetical protein